MAPTSRWDANFVEKNVQGRNAEPIAGVANKTCRRGERPLFSPVNSETITKTLNCSAAVSESGDTVETKRAAHPFSAIRMRSLNDPHQGSLPTVKPLSPPPRHLHQVPTDASVTIRLLIPIPRQRVIRISAETDDLAKSGSAKLGSR